MTNHDRPPVTSGRQLQEVLKRLAEERAKENRPESLTGRVHRYGQAAFYINADDSAEQGAT